jgi:hypothetical protein
LTPEAADVAEVGHLVLNVCLAHVVDQMVLGKKILVADPKKEKINGNILVKTRAKNLRYLEQGI